MTDLTPSWDDLDPAELDFGGGALDTDVVALDAEPVDVDIPPGPPSVGEVAAVDAGEILPGPPSVDDDAVEVDETAMDTYQAESVDDFDEFEDLDAQFADDPTDPDALPDDFDLD